MWESQINIYSLLSLAITGHGAGLGGLSLVTVTAPPSWPGQVSRHETRFTTNIFRLGLVGVRQPTPGQSRNSRDMTHNE